MDFCTLYHLRNQLQRRAVTKKVKTDPTSCEDFFLLVTTGHLLYVVMSAIGMSSLEDSPSDECYSDFANKSEGECKEIFEKTMRDVLDSQLKPSLYHPVKKVAMNSYHPKSFQLAMKMKNSMHHVIRQAMTLF